MCRRDCSTRVLVIAGPQARNKIDGELSEVVPLGSVGFTVVTNMQVEKHLVEVASCGGLVGHKDIMP